MHISRRWNRFVSRAEATFLCCALAFLSSATAGAALRAQVVSPLAQVFPDAKAAPAGTRSAHLEAARGEWEPFQIVVRSDGATALAGVSARAAALQGEKGAALAPPQLYRVGYLTVKIPSSVEGHAGPWPDPLIPDVDAFVGEKRRAFPFAVPAGEARAIWVDLFVPESAAPGVYRGQVIVSATDSPSVRVPIELTVHRFALPRSSSLPVTFGISREGVARAHPGLSPDELDRLVARYGVAALRDRVSLHGGSMAPPDYRVRADGGVEVDFRAYDAEVGPFLDGTADRGGPAEGARYSAIDLRLPGQLTGPARVAYGRAVVEHLRKRGWLDRVFHYTFDEPSEAKLGEVRERAADVKRLAPEVPRLVTRQLDESLFGAVDIWCPVVNFVDDKPGNSNMPARARYDAHLQRGERIWWYQACMSHGCDIVGGEYFTGWPSLVVDAPAMAHRIFEWLTFRYRMGGELYYDTVEAFARGRDPWEDQHLFGGNGDGTLFYPGTPARIGGRTPIPVESIRLKLVREGLEDYEYLRLHEERVGREAAEAIAASIAPRTFQWQHDPARLMAARHQLATDLDRASVQTLK